MKKFMSLHTISFVLLTMLILYGCAVKPTASKPEKDVLDTGKSKESVKIDSPVGTWEYSLETPDGIQTGSIKIIQIQEKYSAELVMGIGNFDFQFMEVEGEKITGSVDIMGAISHMEAKYEGDEMTGTVFQDDLVMKLKAVRTERD